MFYVEKQQRKSAFICRLLGRLFGLLSQRVTCFFGLPKSWHKKPACECTLIIFKIFQSNNCMKFIKHVILLLYLSERMP